MEVAEALEHMQYLQHNLLAGDIEEAVVLGIPFLKALNRLLAEKIQMTNLLKIDTIPDSTSYLGELASATRDSAESEMEQEEALEIMMF